MPVMGIGQCRCQKRSECALVNNVTAMQYGWKFNLPTHTLHWLAAVLAALSYIMATPSLASATLDPAGTVTLTRQNCSKEELLHLPNARRLDVLLVTACRRLGSLENSSLAPYQRLTTLQLTDSGLTQLEGEALVGLQQLRVLSLARNNISTLTSWATEPFKALVTLDVQDNAIADIRTDRLVCYPNLQRLNLARNALTQLTEGAFRTLPQLKQLDLGHNRLQHIEVDTFQGMERLTYLSLRGNAITDIAGDAFATNLHLRTLRLDSNRLVSLAFMQAVGLSRLLHLNVSQNAIASLEQLADLKDAELIELDVSYNRIENLTAQTFQELYLLERLNVSNNALRSLATHSFARLSGLEHLDLSCNGLAQLPGDLFRGTHLLRHINLSHNALASMTAAAAAEATAAVAVGALFGGMPYLHMVDLSGNQLRTADANVVIDALASEVDCTQLSLLLRDNQLDALNIDALKSFKRVELAGNHWGCRWLIREMLHVPASISFGRNYTVATAWSDELLDANGIQCYDDYGSSGGDADADKQQQRIIVVVDMRHVWQPYEEKPKVTAICDNTSPMYNVTTLPAPWPKLRLDRFDSRSVILWMLFGIAVAFAALRVGRRFVDKKEHKRVLIELHTKQQALDKQQLLKNSSAEFNADGQV